VDQSTRHFEREKAEQPEHEKDNEDSPDHGSPFQFPGLRDSILAAETIGALRSRKGPRCRGP
jgi:hypothetical protein